MADLILGIESSCDDTSAAVIRDGWLLSNVIASQDVHRAFGGVVPELASRAHEQNIVPVVSEALSRAGVQAADLTAIAFTRGPGLLGSLLVGTSFARVATCSFPNGLVDVPLSRSDAIFCIAGGEGSNTGSWRYRLRYGRCRYSPAPIRSGKCLRPVNSEMESGTSFLRKRLFMERRRTDTPVHWSRSGSAGEEKRSSFPGGQIPTIILPRIIESAKGMPL